jgi:bifunctional enzyme CysN/CysC
MANSVHPERSSLLRFVTCGSVDDGKSTLIGRLLLDTNSVYEDQLVALARDSKQFGTQGDALDPALLVDGLAAERAQGITIDVAYRYFATNERKFIVIDSPGHEQYTRNMVTGASNADLAVVLVDARKGVLQQTRRHCHVLALLGVRSIVLAVNKMDLVEFDQAVFMKIDADFRVFATTLAITDIASIPVSAFRGDNVCERSPNMPWYEGMSLLETLHQQSVQADELASSAQPLRMTVQWVNRPSAAFRGYSGRVLAGMLRVGDAVTVLPSKRDSTVKQLVEWGNDSLDAARAGRSVTVLLADEIDVGRGDLIVARDSPAQVADQFEADIVWMSDAPLVAGRAYLLKAAARTVSVTVSEPKFRRNVDTFEELAAKTLALNDIGVCVLTTAQLIAFDPYAEQRGTGSFILIDRSSSETVAAGMIRFALRRSQNVHWQATTVNRAARAAALGQKPRLLWLTGLSGAGKSTIADLVEKQLHAMGRHTYLLDGDNVRHGLCHDLGFTEADRIENIRRVSEVARLMVDAGLIVIASFISPYSAERHAVREKFAADEFVEIFVDASLELAESRDPKGLYKKARRGELRNFTGIDAPYEAPTAPELHIDTALCDAETAARRIVDFLDARP